MPTIIAKQLANLNSALAQAVQQAGRAPDSCSLVAVSKHQPLPAIIAAVQAGQRQFGENYLQEAESKILALQSLPDMPRLQWHFIGALQANKARRVAELFDWIHTIDRLRIAQRLSRYCPEGKRLQVCLQINIDADPQKAGIAPDAARELLEACQLLPNLVVRGLMTIRDPGKDASESFVRLARLFDELKPFAEPQWDTLSMGMSNDYAAAIRAGATLIRIGTALFGPRPTI